MSNDKFVSIIIPTRNEEQFIERCLNSCLNQTYPKEKIEIIVVDGMSEDRTRDVVKNFSQSHPNIRLIDNTKKIAPSAMNIGIKQSRGDIVVRVDGHAEIDRYFIENCVKKISQNEQIWAVGGPIETIGETNVAKCIAIAMSTPFGVGNSTFRTVKNQERYVDTVPFPASPRKIYDIVGYYDEELIRNQDDEHNLRILEKGGKILLVPEIKSKYFSRSSFKSLFRQYYQYGFYKVRVIQKHPDILRIRHFVPALFVFSSIISILVLLFIPVIGKIIFILFWFTYLASNFLTSFYLSRFSLIKFFGISLAFSCLHFGYGAGFLSGIWHFVITKTK